MYCAAVLDAFSRRIVGWSIADHMRTELVIDALGMAISAGTAGKGPATRRSCIPTTARNTRPGRSGKRLREAGLLGSMGTVGDCYDNAMMESFWGTMQLELLDPKKWATRDELANADLRVDRMLVQSRQTPFQYRNAQPD